MNNFPLRLPPDVEAAIRQLAKEHDRTVNKEIVQACKAWIQVERTRKPMLQYSSKSGNYEATVDGQHVEVDSDVFAETLAQMQKDGMSWQEAMNELSSVSTWTGSTPMHGVYIDGVAQE